MKIFIGCSSKDDIDKVYFDKSYMVVSEVLKYNDLVFGSNICGLMGMCYKEACKNGRDIIGVSNSNKVLDNISNNIRVNSISERTLKCIEFSDVILFLPGGVGTMQEVFTAIESKIELEHNKDIIIYNLDGFYDNLVKLLSDIYRERFTILDRDMYYVFDNYLDIIDYIKNKYI